MPAHDAHYLISEPTAYLAAIALALAAAGVAWLRYGFRRDIPEYRKPLPWQYAGLMLVYTAAVWSQAELRGESTTLIRWLMAGVLVFTVLQLVRRFYKERIQFSLRALLLFVTVVAVLCSAAHYIPPVPLLLGATFAPALWIGVKHRYSGRP